MKVLGISGSPRKEGNTDHAVKVALEIIGDERPDAEVEFLRMADYSLEHCKGCRHFMTHVEYAIEGDDLGLLVGKMHTSDPIILRAPVYWWSPSRTSSTEPTPSTPTIRRFEGKKVTVITVVAQSGFSSHEPEEKVSEIFKVAPWVLN